MNIIAYLVNMMMSYQDLKAVLAKYQQKAFDLFNRNIVLETQVEGKKYYLLNLDEEEMAAKSVSRILTYGGKTAKGDGADVAGAEDIAPEAPAEETPTEETPAGV